MRYMTAHLRKLIGRNDIKVSLAVFFALPMLLAYLISIKSGIMQVGNTKFGGFAYAAVMLEMLKSFFLIHVMLAIFTSTFIGGEIDTGIENMYMAKAQSRQALIVTKLAAMSIVAVLLFATLFVAGVGGWFFFLRLSEFGEPTFLTGETQSDMYLTFTMVRSLLEMICMTSIFGLFSLFFAQNKALVLSFVTVVGMKMISNWRVIRNFVPTYIGSSAILNNLEGAPMVKEGLIGAAILLLYTMIITAVSTVRYTKMDLARS